MFNFIRIFSFLTVSCILVATFRFEKVTFSSVFFFRSILSAILINLLALLISEGVFKHFSVRIVNIPISQCFFSYHTNVIEVGSVYINLLNINYVALFLYRHMEFFDNGATCYTSLAIERTFPSS